MSLIYIIRVISFVLSCVWELLVAVDFNLLIISFLNFSLFSILADYLGYTCSINICLLGISNPKLLPMDTQIPMPIKYLIFTRRYLNSVFFFFNLFIYIYIYIFLIIVLFIIKSRHQSIFDLGGDWILNLLFKYQRFYNFFFFLGKEFTSWVNWNPLDFTLTLIFYFSN